MARIEGIEPKQTSFLMRQVFKKVRKVLGRDLTPQKIVARVPRVFWVSALTEWLLGQKAQGSATVEIDDYAADCGSDRVSVLNRFQFCGLQNIWDER